MPNSLIEDVLNDEPNNNGNGGNIPPQGKKKSKKPLIICLIIILIIIVAVVAVLYLQQNNGTSSNKAKFFEALVSNNIDEVMDTSLHGEFFERLLTEDSSAKTDVSISYTGIDETLSSIDLTLDSEYDVDNKISNVDLDWIHSNNNLLNVKFIITDEAIGFMSDAIVQPYVGFTYNYLAEADIDIANDLTEDIESEINIDISEDVSDVLSDLDVTDTVESLIDMDAFELSDESKELYKEVLDENFEEDDFTSKDVTLQMDSGNVDATEYTLTILDEDLWDIAIKLFETFESDTETINSLTSMLKVFGIDSDTVSLGIQFIDSLLTDSDTDYVYSVDDDDVEYYYDVEDEDEEDEYDYDEDEEEEDYEYDYYDEEDEDSYIEVEEEDEIVTYNYESETSEPQEITISVYDKEGETVKISISYGEYTAEVEFGYGDSENYMKITVVDESESGFSIKITNDKSDLKDEIDMVLSIIEKSSVTTSVEVDMTVVKSGSDYNVELVVTEKGEDSNFNLEISMDASFENVEIDTPVYGEEFVILNEMDEDTMNSTVEQIYDQIEYVIEDALAGLPFINSNTGSTTVEQIEAERVETDEDEEAAREALQEELDRLINEREENSEALEIEDLRDLEIDGYDVSVEVGNDIAIVTIGDYIFNIDSEFEISD